MKFSDNGYTYVLYTCIDKFSRIANKFMFAQKYYEHFQRNAYK